MRDIIIGTAGHIDHGKTTLIKYLTGKDTDTLPEEKKRGMTIDIGFSFLDGENGTKIGIVDVPGHEKFIKNMTVGISGIDYVVFLISADDGIMPQSEEHFNIINLLGIKHGVIVLSKVDLVEEDTIARRKNEIAEYFKGTFLENAKILETSIKDKGSFERVKNFVLEDLKKLNFESEESLEKPFRMYIDRCFSIKGFGTVVTGTVMQGNINLDDKIYIYPQNIVGRIKGIENHGNKILSIGRGKRCALNLAQIDKSIIKRGNIISSDRNFDSSKIIDVMLKPLREKKLKHNQRIRLHIGTREVIGRLRLFEENNIFLEKTSKISKYPAQLILEEEVSAVYGELGIIRNFSPMDTIAGVKILNIYGKKVKRTDKEYINNLLNLDKKGFLEENTDNSDKLLKILDNFHKENYILRGILRAELKNTYFPNMDIREFRDFIDKNLNRDIIKVEKIAEKEYISKKEFKVKLTKEDKIFKEEIFKLYKESGLVPLKRSIIENVFKDKDMFIKIHNYLVSQEMLIYLSEDYYILRGFFREIQKKIKLHFEDNDRLSISDLREIIGINRELAIIILEKLDSIEFTKRIENYRILKKEKCDD